MLCVRCRIVTALELVRKMATTPCLGRSTNRSPTVHSMFASHLVDIHSTLNTQHSWVTFEMHCGWRTPYHFELVSVCRTACLRTICRRPSAGWNVVSSQRSSSPVLHTVRRIDNIDLKSNDCMPPASINHSIKSMITRVIDFTTSRLICSSNGDRSSGFRWRFGHDANVFGVGVLSQCQTLIDL